MNSTNLNIRTDVSTKEQAEKVLDALGLNMTTAVNIFLKQVVLTQSIPFDLAVRPYNEATAKALDEANKIAQDKNVKGYTSIVALREALSK